MQVDIAEESASSGGVLIRMRSSIVEAKKEGLFWGGGGDFNYFEHVFKERTRQINQGTFY